jgi:hypothetical protein
MTQIRKAFVAPDGKVFFNAKEVEDYVRRPKIEEALKVVTGNNKDLMSWLLDNQEHVEVAFESGNIKRVTKAEKKKLASALNHIAEVLKDDPKAAFVVENHADIADTFRWPSVKRMNDEEKALATRTTLLAATEGREDLVEWIIAHKDNILAAYEAGVEKRAVSSKATEALAAWRAKKAAEKKAAQA